MCFANYSEVRATKKCSERSWVRALASGYSREKGAFVCQMTHVLFHPTFAREIAAFDGKETGLIVCKTNSARRSGRPCAGRETDARGLQNTD